MRNIKKTLCLLMAAVMLAGFTACGGTTPSGNSSDTGNSGSTGTPVTTYETDDAKVYDLALSEFAAALKAAQAETSNVSLRYALMAIAEAKLMESAVYVPTQSNGGSYAISRVAPYTVGYCLWGNDSYRYHQALVATEPLTTADRTEMKAKWAELKGTGTYESWAKTFLADKGYTLKDSYTIAYATDPTTWDILNTYRSADSEAIVNTFDGLIEYDNEGTMKPALAESWTISDDGLTYTFKLRAGATWVDSQGREVAKVTADDWVAGLQHCLDTGATSYLVDGVIKGATEYINGEITDFSQVGVKATDDSTLVYTLEKATPYFMSMFGYNPFAPLCRSYFTSKGGVFGLDNWAAIEAIDYGKDKDNIVYCGPYLVTNATASNKIVFSANPTYWNADNINIKTLTWLYNDGDDVTKAYKDMKAGTIDGAGLNTATLELAKDDGWFEKYHYTSATDATSFGVFYNLRRGGYALYTDETAVVTTMTEEQQTTANIAMQNVHFRRALAFAMDRAAYNAQSVGDELKLLSVINSYTPGNFVYLEEDVTVAINGTDTTFKAGTAYGAIMQAQIDADGVKIKVWDPAAEEGAGSSAGFDGWYNAANAKEELAAAVKDLGFAIDKDNPVVLEMPYPSNSEVYTNRANAIKKSVEDATDGAIVVNLLNCPDYAAWYDAGYYCDSGSQCNYNIYDCSGWGPDYGDPQTYLNTLQGDGIGDMIAMLGIY